MRKLSEPLQRQPKNELNIEKILKKNNMSEIGHLTTRDNKLNLPWCLSLREKREMSSSIKNTRSVSTETFNRLHEMKTETQEIHLIEKEKEKNNKSNINSFSGNPSIISGPSTPRNSNGNGCVASGSGMSIISGNGSTTYSKKWCNSVVKSPKLTSHNFPDIMPVEHLSHF